MHQTNVVEFEWLDNETMLNSSDYADKLLALDDPYPLHVIAIFTTIYLATFVVGLAGNVITCVVIISNNSMHTVPNCYLFNLAMSDILLLLSGLPFDIITSWDPDKYDFGYVGCFMRGWLSETSADVSILTITAFTFERYLAVCRPITAQVMSKLSRAVKLIIVIWIVSFLCGAVIAYQSNHINSKCSFLLTIPYSLDVMALLFFVVPLVIITILYILIGKSLQRSEKMKDCRRYSSDVNSRNTLKMLVAIVVVFFVSWAPFQAQRMLSVHAVELIYFGYDAIKLINLTSGLYYISGVFYYFSAAVNPIIYNIMSNKFRDAFKETISKCWRFIKQSLCLSTVASLEQCTPPHRSVGESRP